MASRGKHALAELLAWGAMSHEQVEQDMRRMMAIEQACTRQEILEEQRMRPPSPFPPRQPAHTPMFASAQVPAEIVVHILAMLPFQSLIRCLRVNNTWRALILDTPELWRSVSFAHEACHAVSTFYLQRYLDRARRQLNCVKIRAPAMIADLLGSDQTVHTLDISGAYVPRTTLPRLRLGVASMFVHTLAIDGSNIPVESAIAIACSVPTLHTLSVKSCCFVSDFENADMLTPSLHHAHNLALLLHSDHHENSPAQSRLQCLDISAMQRSSIHALVWILYRCPRLCTLHAKDCGIVLSTFFRACLMYCPALTLLHYSPQHCTWPWQHQHSVIPYCDSRFVTTQDQCKIKSITLSDTHIHPKLLAFILERCLMTLEALHIERCWLMRSDALLCLTNICPPRLKHVTLGNSTSFVDPDTLITLAKAFPALETLAIRGDRHAVTDRVVLVVISNLHRLRQLDLRGCALISRHIRPLLCDSRLLTRL